MRESEIQTAIRLALGRCADLVLWRNAAVGVFVAFEIKTPRGRLTDEQRMFGELVQRRGGFFAVLRSVEDAEQALDQARKEIRSRLAL